MGIGKAFDRFGDWMTSGSDASALAKMLGVTALAVGAVVSPFVYVANQNSNAFDALVQEMDQSRSVVFNSVAQCEREGFGTAACTQSRDAAMRIAQSLGTDVSYSTMQECFNRHGQCSTTMVMIPVTISSGNTTTTTYIPTETHFPPVAGWQTMRSDMNKSVPLYALNGSADMVRRDGKVLKPAGM